VLRDYHVDNLIWLDDRVGIKKVGLLDFQDAVMGSYAYDVVSLLEDARRTVTATVVDEMINYYLDRMKTLERRKFISDYKILGVQRACKIIGIFARKSVRDNDTRYLKHLPRVWGYIRQNIQHPMLMPVKLWFDKLKLDMMKA
jgi:aminoglycoside/choline kinase family phosphotransferase